jgi:transmembrane sensor
MDANHQPAEERFYTLLSRQLAKSINDDEKKELLNLVMADADLQFKADLFARMWNNESKLSHNEDLNEAFMRHLLKYRSDFLPAEENESTVFSAPRKSFWRYKWLLATLACLVILLTGWWLKDTGSVKPVSSPPPALSSVVTRYGNKSRISLPDGSQVWLNAGSRLDYINSDFTNNKREVYLSGEAYFEIIHNAYIPFIVRSGTMQVKVLGTSFNVKAYPEEDNMETSLIRGSVEITIKDRPDDVYILKPNEKLVISNDRPARKMESSGYQPAMVKEAGDIVSLKKVDYTAAEKLILETAWVQNKLVFRSEKFADLAVKMERWYGTKIRFRDKGKEELMFTGIFTTETITQALNAMRVVHPFHFTVENDTIYID